MLSKDDKDREIATKSRVIFASVLVFGLLGMALYSIDNFKVGGWSILGNSFLIAGGTFLVGLLLGFLFGIPRTLQGDIAHENNDGSKSNISYQVNTNLEQISDWLTKILVGVGLTQLNKLPDLLTRLSNTLRPAFGNQGNSGVYGAAIVVFFLAAGFLTGYLVTRIYIGRIFRIADESVLEKEIEELKNQSSYDALALEMVSQQLNQPANQKTLKEGELKKAIENASASARYTIFLESQKVRKNNWQNNQDLMERTIPVFQALIETEKGQLNHQYYGQMGYALKDKKNPELRLALEYLTKAIKTRGNYRKHGWTLYEFNSAVCKIGLDENFGKGIRSTPDNLESIENDLKAIRDEVGSAEFKYLVESTQTIPKWLTINGLSLTK